MRKTKSVRTLLVLMLTLSFLAACSNGTTTNKATSPSDLPTDEKVTLKIGFFEGGMGREWFDYAVDTFKKKYPNVSIDVISSPKIDTITSTKISANDDADMFDLFSGSVPGGAAGIEALVAAGKLESQEDLWDHKSNDGSGKTIKELSLDGGFTSATRVLGKTYELPIAATGAGLLYNKQLFVKNGWNENPKTWNEFTKLLDDIKAKAIIPITFPGFYPTYIANAFGAWKEFEIAENKGTLSKVQDDYRNFKLPGFLAPENIELWNRIYDMGKKGYFAEGLAALTHTQSQMQVIQEKAAMVSTGTWVENEMKEAAPANFKWGFMAVPMGDKPDSTKWVRLSSGYGFKIWAAKPELNKKWAKEFVVWLWNMDVQSSIAEKGGMLPVRKDFMDDKDRALKIQDAPKAMFEYMKNNKVMMESGVRNVTLTDPAYAQATKVINEATVLIATGKQEPLPILQKAEELLKNAIDAQKK